MTQFVSALTLLCCTAVPLAAQDSSGSGSGSGSEPDPSTYTRIEEDWLVFVQNPDEAVTAPQIVNVISPLPHTWGPFGIIELNHASVPDFDAGGFQIQSWVGPYDLQALASLDGRSLSHDYDRISYTVAMEIEGEHFRFSLKDGFSRAWGDFPKEKLDAKAPRYDLDLSHYTPAYSAANTSINVGAHRVEIMYLTETRYYVGETLVKSSPTNHVLHRYQHLVEFVSETEYQQNADQYNIDITE